MRMAMTAMVLYASWTMPARFKVLYRVGCFGSSTQEVTYQVKNIYGIDIGEEYTVIEPAPWSRIFGQITLIIATTVSAKKSSCSSFIFA